MDFILDKLDTVSVSAVIVVTISAFLVAGWLISKRKDISDIWNSWYQNRKKKDELLQMVLDDHKRISEYENNRIHDREQSFRIQKELVDSQNSLSEQISSIVRKLDEMEQKTDDRFLKNEEKNNKRIRAELKDKIMRAYRVYHERGHWNEMEKEAFYDLVEEYNQVSGNSFVHRTIVPESYTWDIRPLE